MRGWRIKFVFLLIVYFSGFATAIYTLAPAPDGSDLKLDKSTLNSVFKTDNFAESFNKGMHKCIDLGKDAAVRSAKFIQKQINERQTKAEG